VSEQVILHLIDGATEVLVCGMFLVGICGIVRFSLTLEEDV